MIVVYLSNRNIRIAEGEYSRNVVKIKGLYQVVDTEGCIVNGSIMDKEGLQALLEEVWTEKGLDRKGVALVVNSSQFTTRVLDAPVMKPGATMEYVRREFADVERIEDPVHTYFPMPGKKKGKTQTLFAGVAPKSFLIAYRQLFEEIGIRVSRIEAVHSPMVRMLGAMDALKGHTCIVQLVSESTLMNVLYVEGSHVYSSRTRLFSDPDTPEFAVETARAVSNILQFAKAQNIETPIREIYIAGMEKGIMEIFADSVRRIDEQMETRKLDPERVFRLPPEYSTEDLENQVLSVGGFWPILEKMGFLAQIAIDPEKEAKKAKRRKTVFALGSLTTVLVLVAGILGWRVYGLKKELKALRAYNEDPAVLEACQAYDEVSAELNVTRQLLTEAQRLEKTTKSYPVADSKVASILSFCADSLVEVDIKGYKAGDGVLTLEATAGQEEKVHQFVGRLEEEEIFGRVDYTGYRQASAGSWTMTIACRLKGTQEE